MTREEWKTLQPVLAAVIEGSLHQDQAKTQIREKHPQLESSFHGLLRAWRETGSFMEECLEGPRFSISDKEDFRDDA